MPKKIFPVILFLGVASILASQSNEPTVMDRVSPFASYGHVYDGDNFESMRPRVMGTFLSLLLATNPIQFPSGEKKGCQLAPSVPSIGWASS